MARISDLEVLSALHPTEWRSTAEVLRLILSTKGKKPSPWSNVLGPTLRRLVSEGFAVEKETDVVIKHGREQGTWVYRLSSSGYRRRVELEAQHESAGGFIPRPAEG